MDLSNPNNWSIVYSSNRTVTVVGTRQWGGIEYLPLADVETTLATPIGLLKLTSNYVNPSTKLPYYGVGCYLDAYLDLAGVRTKVASRKCAIHEGTFLSLPNFGVYPYKLLLSFPYWIQQVYVELRQFTDQSGRYLDQDESVLYTAVEVVEQQQQRLEELIRQQQGGV